MDLLATLQAWYSAQCNGDWEHHYGIKIDTCDNPGWWVKIDLVGTSLQTKTFAAISHNVDANGFQNGPQWLNCRIEGNVWHGAGDETKLSVILQTFLAWAASKSD